MNISGVTQMNRSNVVNCRNTSRNKRTIKYTQWDKLRTVLLQTVCLLPDFRFFCTLNKQQRLDCSCCWQAWPNQSLGLGSITLSRGVMQVWISFSKKHLHLETAFCVHLHSCCNPVTKTLVSTLAASLHTLLHALRAPSVLGWLTRYLSSLTSVASSLNFVPFSLSH